MQRLHNLTHLLLLNGRALRCVIQYELATIICFLCRVNLKAELFQRFLLELNGIELTYRASEASVIRAEAGVNATLGKQLAPVLLQAATEHGLRIIFKRAPEQVVPEAGGGRPIGYVYGMSPGVELFTEDGRDKVLALIPAVIHDGAGKDTVLFQQVIDP